MVTYKDTKTPSLFTQFSLYHLADLNRQFYVEPDRRAEFIRLMEEHDAVWGFESEVYCKDGRAIWISENARSIRDTGGRIVGFEGTTLDITDRNQAEQEIQRRANEFSALYETARDLARMQRDVPALLQTIVQRAVALLAASGGAIYLYDTTRGDLEVRVTTDPFISIGTRLQLGEGMAGRVAQTHEPLIVDDYRAWPQRSSKYEGTPFTAVIEVPILYSGELIGVLAVNEVGVHAQNVGLATTHTFTEDDARLLSLFAEQAASAVYNVRLYAAAQEELAERKLAEQALHESETRFKSLFEDSPISLWEEDFSLVAAYLDELRHSGVTDFRAYFENHPDAVVHCAALVKVIDVNKATLKLYTAKSKEDFLASPNVVFTEESFPTFREELIALADGKTGFESETINQTFTGDKLSIALSWSVAPGDDKGLRRLFVSISDITARKQAEGKLAAKVIEVEQHNNEVTLLNTMGDLLQTCQTVEEAGAVVSQFAQKLFTGQSGALYLIAPSRNFVEAVADWGESPIQDRVFTPDDCWALRRGQVHYMADPRSGLLCRHVRQSFGSERQPKDYYLCVPMMAQGETLGILHLQSDQPAASQTGQEQEALTASQQQLAVTLAEHIALALANLKLREALRSQAIRDPLTGLFNRRYMEETLERELRRAERRKAPLGIIMFDLDHFKKFNDTFGHAAGDVVLREIGAFLQARVRVEDIACRYGGEEFLVILPEASLEDTVKRAEQLCVGIKGLNVRYQDQALGAVTVSLGVAVFPEHGSTDEAIRKAADAALYRAKREGRDRVVVAASMNA